MLITSNFFEKSYNKYSLRSKIEGHMISFSELGSYGRLGNQLFQYAFLRETARRLGARFYCPKWSGDSIFDLADEKERSDIPAGITKTFYGDLEAGFDAGALEIKDNTDIRGYFQSERFYKDPMLVKKWYSFKKSIVDSVNLKYPTDLMNTATSLSLRIDSDYAKTREYFPLYPISYYENGLKRCKNTETVLIFSDRPDLAVGFFKSIKNFNIKFITDLDAYQQLYLMTQCHANIITNSTFAWWGAWLNQRDDRTVIAPIEWCRPGIPRGIKNILCDDWIGIRGTIPVWDHFQIWRFRKIKSTIDRIYTRLFRNRELS